MRKLLIHTCCAPCFSYIENELKEKGLKIADDQFEKVDFTAFWYNPNIHPKVEYERRKNTFIKFCEDHDCKNVIVDEYSLDGYVKYVVENVGENKKYDKRCRYCYYLRLEEAFKYAKNNGFDVVTTTLTISPYQNHEFIKEVGCELAKKYEIEFKYVDYRNNYREGQKMARENELYMQKYCGCIFSIDNGKWVY